MDACFVWFVLAFLLAIIAVVGHLMWLVMAAIFRSVFGDPPKSVSLEETESRCVLCGRRLVEQARTCTRCGLDSQRQEAVELRELEITLRRLAHLERSGQLPAETQELAKRCIDQRRHELLGRLEKLVGFAQEPARRPQRPLHRPTPIPVPAEEELAKSGTSEPKDDEQIVPTVLPVKRAVPPPLPQIPAVAALVEVETKIEVPPIPLPPRRSFGEMLSGFMEARNILWGELVGGLLIVGCSIALVISLREALEKIPYFPFVIVSAIAAALIGAVRYTLSHWKLESTSRGLLVIGTLLVPLSFTVLAGLASDRGGDFVELGTEVAAIALFTWLVRGAAGIVFRQSIGDLAPRTDWLSTVAILGASASQLLVPHILENGLTRDWLGLVGYVPAVLFVTTQAMSWRRAYQKQHITPRQAGGLFLSLAMAAYAVVVVFGFILYRAENINRALEYLAVPVALAGLPLLLSGTIASARLRRSEVPANADADNSGLPLGVAGVIATLLSLGGTLVLLAALGAAWPNSVRLAVIASVNTAVLAFVAHRFRLAPALAPAQICFAAAALAGYHAAAGADLASVRLWLMPSSGVVLLFVGAVLATVAELQMRAGRTIDGHYLGIGSWIAALASLGLVGADGWDSAGQAGLVFGAVAFGAWLANARWRLTWLTGAAAAIAWGGAFFAVRWYVFDAKLPLAETLTWSLLAAAVVDVVLAAVVDRLASRAKEPLPGELRRAFVLPSQGAALTASAVGAVALVGAVSWDWLDSACVATLGLAAVWAALAWRLTQPPLFAVFQGALIVACLFGVVIGLQEQPWFTRDIESLLGDVRSWQAYGVGLSALALAWVVARFGLKRSERAWALVEPGWPTPDRLLLGAMVILAAVVTVGGAMPAIALELTPQAFVPRTLLNSGLLGWCWIGLLAVGLVLVLWQGRAVSAIPGLVAVALSAAVLAAMAFEGDLAVASALRWALASCFVAGSALLWWREGLAKRAIAAGIQWDQAITPSVRVLLVVGALVPVLVLTAINVALRLVGSHPSGPLSASVFGEMGTIVNNMVPLALLCASLVGHGIRDRSAGHAFAAGLVALLTVVGGHALHVVHGGGTLGSREFVELGQLATGALAVWLVLWLGVRQGLRPGKDNPSNMLPCSTMLRLQHAMIWASYLIWLFPAVAMLAFPARFEPGPGGIEEIFKTAAGTWLGWLAVGLGIVAGAAYRVETRRPVPSWFVGMVGLLIGGLTACTVAIYVPAWDPQAVALDQRVLMLVAAGLSLTFVLTIVRWSIANPGKWLLTSKDSSVELAIACGVGALAVILGLERAVRFDDPLWSAAAIAIVAIAMIAAAWLRRAEGLILVGGLLAMLAVSLIVLDAHRDSPLTSLTVLMTQANLATAGVVGLIWLGCLRHFVDDSGKTATGHPWLYLQLVVTFLGNAALLLVGFEDLLDGVQETNDWQVLAIGNFAGWLALLPSAVGMVCLLHRLAPGLAIHAFACSGLMFGVLAACTVTHLDHGHTWFGFHVLTLSWLLVAGALLVAGWRADLKRQALPICLPAWSLHLVPKWSAVSWVSAIGAAVATLAFGGGSADPYWPGWACAAVIMVSIEIGALAIWTRGGGFVYGSGLLVNLVGHLLWLAWAEEVATSTNLLVILDRVGVERLLVVHFACLGLASLLWSGIQLGGPRLVGLPRLVGEMLPFRHAAVWAALLALGATVASIATAGLEGFLTPLDPAVWYAVAAILAATLATFWDAPEEKWACPPQQVYLLGLVIIVAGLHGAQLDLREFVWAGTVALGPYLLFTALLCAWGLRNPGLGQKLGMPSRPSGWPLQWFGGVQLIFGAIVLLLSAWICLDFDGLGDRLGGVLAVACLPAAGWLLTPHWHRLSLRDNLPAESIAAPGPDLGFPRLMTMLLGVVACVWLHCSFVNPADIAPWLHRSLLAMAAVTWMSVLYGLLLPRLLASERGWAAAAQRLAAPLGLLACALLMLVLAQEFVLYDARPEVRRTPMNPAGVVVVSIALAVLIGGALASALSPARDRLKLSEKGRTLYVYAAEILIALLLFHVRLNVPDFFPKVVGQYWVFAIVAVAFVGVGLSELCQRRGLRVLADPLQRTAMLLPLLPILAFMVRPLSAPLHAAEATFAGLSPLVGYLDRLPDDFRWHAAVWFLIGLLYLVVALTRRSSNLGLGAAVAANFGLWVLLGNHGHLGFLLHPQLWLIPIGAIVLAAETLNRDRLQPAQALALRYAGVLLIYVSSSADMFIAGLGHNVLLPIALAIISVAGVLLGILLRVRAFLFLGMTFLFLVVFSQIWHAAVDQAQTWVWWASGIVLGVAILTLFALFEKRRNDVLKLIDDIKRWR